MLGEHHLVALVVPAVVLHKLLPELTAIFNFLKILDSAGCRGLLLPQVLEDVGSPLGDLYGFVGRGPLD